MFDVYRAIIQSKIELFLMKRREAARPIGSCVHDGRFRIVGCGTIFFFQKSENREARARTGGQLRRSHK